VSNEQDNPQQLEAWRETCEAAARAGGDELKSWRGRFKTREKGVSDLVTDADVASQAAVQGVIAAQFPNDAFLGEEQTLKSARPKSDQLIWIVDPLDGTTNYVHGYPNYAVSVAVARGNDLLAGVIYDPVRDQCFSAAKGQGAWCDGEPLKTSSTTRISATTRRSAVRTSAGRASSARTRSTSTASGDR